MILFISDIHLPVQVDHPLSQTFIHFLHYQALLADELYILGDLFDVWLGDDIGLTQYAHIIRSLAAFTQSGRQLWVQQGNRDFLLSCEFAEATGAQMLPEISVCLLAQQQLVLCHGDALCTDDVKYLSLRSQLRQPLWQRQFLSQSVSERVAFVQRIQQESQLQKEEKSSDIMDVTQIGVEALMASYPLGTHLIHGHTHRPAIHEMPQGGCRYVLSDWRPAPVNLLAWTQKLGLHHIAFQNKNSDD